MCEQKYQNLPNTIAIDGPAASGKSTIGNLIANKLGFLCLDTGIMYRAVAFQALKKGVDVFDDAAVSQLAEKIKIEIRPSIQDDGRQFDVIIEGKDHTWDIRSPEVNQVVSEVSAYPRVREAMTRLQREIARNGRIVMIGRDIGTVVLPQADMKIYLEASVEVRAQRRYIEELARDKEVCLDDIEDSLRHRDEIDSGRAVAPLKPAEDAVVVNSDHMTVFEVVEHIMGLISQR
ncbi:MAG TPA: (d)CMP kinase [Anaerolineaceae bacterium]|nr:(d)CMP kinase [Anaerolineaceae bacterium]